MTPKPKKPSPRTKKNSRPWITDEGVKRLRQVKKLILMTPGLYNQKYWCCGTALCIAGHAAMMADPDMELACPDPSFPTIMAPLNEDGYADHAEWKVRGRAALGIADGQERRLFDHPEDWPYPFCVDYDNAGTPAERAKVAARRIEHFIKTGL